MTTKLTLEDKTDLTQASYMLATIKQIVDSLDDLTNEGIRNSPDLKYLRMNWNSGCSYLDSTVEQFVETFNGFFDKFCDKEQSE